MGRELREAAPREPPRARLQRERDALTIELDPELDRVRGDVEEDRLCRKDARRARITEDHGRKMVPSGAVAIGARPDAAASSWCGERLERSAADVGIERGGEGLGDALDPGRVIPGEGLGEP